MLLNRRRINRWAKISAGALAFIFAFSFVTMGVGSGLNVNWLDLWSSIGGGGSNSTSSGSADDRLADFESILAGDPNNYDALIGAANEAAALSQTAQEASYVERAVQVRESVELYRRLAAIYSAGDARNDEAAVRVLNKVTQLDPNDADSFLQLGASQRNLGNTSAAILAWNRYLELAPEGEMAATVKQQIEQLSAVQATTTTTASATTTSVP